MPVFHVQKEKGIIIPVLHITKGKLWVIKTYCSMQGKFNTNLETGHKLHRNPSEAWDLPIFEAHPS